MMTNNTLAKMNKPMMTAFKCKCGIVLGWTDGVTLAVGHVSFCKVVTGRCAGCGKCRTWRPVKATAPANAA